MADLFHWLMHNKQLYLPVTNQAILLVLDPRRAAVLANPRLPQVRQALSSFSPTTTVNEFYHLSHL